MFRVGFLYLFHWGFFKIVQFMLCFKAYENVEFLMNISSVLLDCICWVISELVRLRPVLNFRLNFVVWDAGSFMHFESECCSPGSENAWKVFCFPFLLLVSFHLFCYSLMCSCEKILTKSLLGWIKKKKREWNTHIKTYTKHTHTYMHKDTHRHKQTNRMYICV